MTHGVPVPFLRADLHHSVRWHPPSYWEGVLRSAEVRRAEAEGQRRRQKGDARKFIMSARALQLERRNLSKQLLWEETLWRWQPGAWALGAGAVTMAGNDCSSRGLGRGFVRVGWLSQTKVLRCAPQVRRVGAVGNLGWHRCAALPLCGHNQATPFQLNEKGGWPGIRNESVRSPGHVGRDRAGRV